MAAAVTNSMRKLLSPQVRQIAFSFNFTELPRGARAKFYRKALRGIDEFVVFSRYEADLYADELNIPAERIRFLHWAMHTPETNADNPLPAAMREAGYIASIGGEGRDYRTFAAAMRQVPHTKAVVVGRPYSLDGVDFPSNVTVFANLPLQTTWRIAHDSLGVVVPLQSSTTATGHITIVGAQLLGLPLAVTDSIGVADYVSAQNALLMPAGDADHMAEAITLLAGRVALAQSAKAQAMERSSPQHLVAHFEQFASGTTSPSLSLRDRADRAPST